MMIRTRRCSRGLSFAFWASLRCCRVIGCLTFDNSTPQLKQTARGVAASAPWFAFDGAIHVEYRQAAITQPLMIRAHALDAVPCDQPIVRMNGQITLSKQLCLDYVHPFPEIHVMLLTLRGASVALILVLVVHKPVNRALVTYIR